MQTLEKNVINTFGQKGYEWLDNLPQFIDVLAKLWSLSDMNRITHLNWNYVATALQHNHIPVILKIGCEAKLIHDEYEALKHFNGHGAVRVLDKNTKYNALLLEQAIPGDLLKKLHPKSIPDTIKIYANVVKELAATPLINKNNYTHVSHWLKAIDRITDPRIEERIIDKAHELRVKLLSSAKQEYLCHGDLHLENIISHGEKWLAIDPKGIVGEMAFEAAAFDLISKDEMKNNLNIPSLITERVTLLSEVLALNFYRLLSWIFLRIIMSAQWFIEDKGDPSQMIALANYVYSLLRPAP